MQTPFEKVSFMNHTVIELCNNINKNLREGEHHES